MHVSHDSRRFSDPKVSKMAFVAFPAQPNAFGIPDKKSYLSSIEDVKNSGTDYSLENYFKSVRISASGDLGTNGSCKSCCFLGAIPFDRFDNY